MSMVSVSEMARQCGLSRSRFYQLIGSTFPFPVYDIASRRPCYTEELQQMCLDVRRCNCGIDGKAVMFYARWTGTPTTAPKSRKVKAAGIDGKHANLLNGLRSLGLTTVTATQLTSVIKELYPSGTVGVEQGEVLRAVFFHLRRQNSEDNVRR
jgi:hypothetical protein